jgi:hypothetical protein
MRPHETPTFGFSAINQNGNLKGEIEYQDHGCDINFHGKVTAAFVTFAVTSIEGSGTLEDVTPVTAEILWTPGFFGNPPCFRLHCPQTAKRFIPMKDLLFTDTYNPHIFKVIF